MLGLLRRSWRWFSTLVRDSSQYPFAFGRRGLVLPAIVPRQQLSQWRALPWPSTASAPSWKVIGPATTRVELSGRGTLGPGHLFGNRSEGTGSPRNPSAENVRLRVGPYPRTTLITSNLTVVSGRCSCNTTTPKAYVFTTTTRIGIKRDPAKRPRSSRPRWSLTPGRLEQLGDCWTGPFVT